MVQNRENNLKPEFWPLSLTLSHRERGYLYSLLILFLLIPNIAHADSLTPPFDVAAIRATVGAPDAKPFTCKQPPAPLRDLLFDSPYSRNDPSRSLIDAAAEAAYKQENKPLSLYENNLASMANRYVRSNPPRADVAACLLDWLNDWAQGDALMGNVNEGGVNIRKWMLSAVANAWLQVRDEPSLDAEKRENAIAWIKKVAFAVRNDYSSDTQLVSHQNNHLTWAAWGVAAAGVALDDRDMFGWAMNKGRVGIGQIQQNGTLPLELARRSRAYTYHLFSAIPLFALAEIAEKNGVDLFSFNNEALLRLAQLNLKNIGHPDDFAQLTGETQEQPKRGDNADFGWIELYNIRYPNDPLAQVALNILRPLKSSRMGGDITLLYATENTAPASPR